MALRDDPEGKQTLAVILSQCFDTMKLYGREPDQLRNAASLFSMVLADFRIKDITRAFTVHLQRSPEMPTPADICNIIRRNGKPPLDRSVYVNLSKKDPQCRTREEWAYMREYEDDQIHG